MFLHAPCLCHAHRIGCSHCGAREKGLTITCPIPLHGPAYWFSSWRARIHILDWWCRIRLPPSPAWADDSECTQQVVSAGGLRAVRRREVRMNAVMESSSIIDSFKAHAEAVSAQVLRVATRESALATVLQLLRQEGVDDQPGCYAVWADGPMVAPDERKQLEGSVPGLKFDVTRELAAAAKVGISQMDWALANTGTLVQSADEVDKRLVSTLPPLHIALLSTAALLPDLAAVLTRVDPAQLGLSFLHHRPQPHGRYRTRADHRRARAGAAHHRAGGRSGGSGDEAGIQAIHSKPSPIPI